VTNKYAEKFRVATDYTQMTRGERCIFQKLASSGSKKDTEMKKARMARS
jgi:hypothetical protein